MRQPQHLSPAPVFTAFPRQARTLLGCFISLLAFSQSSWGAGLMDARARFRAEDHGPHSALEIQRTGADISGEVIALRPREPVRQALKGGERQLFKITVGAGQYARVVVEKHGIEVEMRLSGSRTRVMDNPSGPHGPMSLSIIAESPRDYTLEVRSTESWANQGEYEVVVEELRAADPADAKRVAAEDAFSEARRLFGEDKKDSYEKSITEYEKSLSYWASVHDPHWEALTRYCLGVTHRRLGNLRVAEKYFDETLKIQFAEYDWRLRAATLNDRGVNYNLLGEQQKALESLNSALAIFQEHQDRRGQASALNNIGLIYHRAGDLRSALEFYLKSLPLRHAENDEAGEYNVLNNIGGVYDKLGEPYKALDYYSRVLQGYQDLDRRGQLTNHGRLGTAFNNVAVILDKLNDWEKALGYYAEALKIYREVGSNPELAAALDNVGELRAALGDPDKAMEYYSEARDILHTKVKDPDTEANVLTHIGQLYSSQGKLTGALGYFGEALKLQISSPRQANIYTNIGAVHAAQHEPQRAIEAYEKALPLWGEDRRGVAITLHKEGEAYALAGDQVKALDYFGKALARWRELADDRGEAAALQGTAGVERDRDNLIEALQRSEEALTIIEKLRTKVTSQQLRTLYFAGQQNYYELNIDLNMRLYRRDGSPRHLAAALEANERSRSRSLIDMLVEAQTDVTQGVDEELLRRERDIQQKLNAKALIQMRLLNGKHTEEQAASLAKEIADLITEYDSLKAEIRDKSPRYARLTQPQALTLEQLQQLLDGDTLLLEFSLGSERSYLWLVSKDSITGSDLLPGRADIETEARRFYELLTAPEPVPGDSPVKRNRRIADAAAKYPAQAAVLSKMLLGPLADKLGNKRLLIVGDGVLQYLPFSALPVPPASGGEVVRSGNRVSTRGARTPYLIEEHEIINLPSAAVLSVLRNEFGNREAGPLSAAVLADPVFDAEDPRFKALKGSRVQARQHVVPVPDLRSSAIPDLRLRSGLELPRLRSTRVEARKIGESIPRSLIALDWDASRATLAKIQNEHYRIVHFATHGVLNTEHPELSGIVLSLVDAHGQPQDDGVLRLHDIYNLKLPAELVVLSGCSTGLGSVIKGEGLVGLTRGFMYAGAPRVVASLWRVDDFPTALLMERFYQHIAKDGDSPAAALRQAQIEMLKGRSYPSPYFWAGFILQGEWRGIR